MDLNLTPSQENYLEHMWNLAGRGPVRVVDLADAVGVKRPSVTRAVSNLASLGLVKHEHYGSIEFTPKGHRAAQFIVRRDRGLKRFLIQILQMDPEMAEDEVCRMEHAVSAEVLQRLDVLLDFFNDRRSLQKEIRQKMERFVTSMNSKDAAHTGAKLHV